MQRYLIMALCLLAGYTHAEYREEWLNYSDYVIREQRQSVFDSKRTVRVDVMLRCPGTRIFIKPLSHGETGKCPNEITVTRYGNGLLCKGDIDNETTL